MFVPSYAVICGKAHKYLSHGSEYLKLESEVDCMQRHGIYTTDYYK